MLPGVVPVWVIYVYQNQKQGSDICRLTYRLMFRTVAFLAACLVNCLHLIIINHVDSMTERCFYLEICRPYSLFQYNYTLKPCLASSTLKPYMASYTLKPCLAVHLLHLYH